MGGHPLVFIGVLLVTVTVVVEFVSGDIEEAPLSPTQPSAALTLSRTSDRQMRKKCNRDIQFCTRQNIDVFGLFVQTVLSIDLKRVNNDEAHQITENLCITFRPIFECIERRNASWCSVPVGQQLPNKLFHISYFVLVCELTKIWRECSVVGNSIETGSQSDKVTSVCSDHFPALNREAEQLRLLNIPSAAFSSIGGVAASANKQPNLATPEMMSDQAVSSSTLASMEFILLNITEQHCEDIMMFAGCQLHWTRSICGNRAYDIVRRLFAAYNDMSGKKCSGNHELQEIDFEALERKYAERYLFPNGASQKPSTARIIISEVVSTQPQHHGQLQQSLRDADPTMLGEESIMLKDSGAADATNTLKQQMEYSSDTENRLAATGPLNSSADRRHHLATLAFTLILSTWSLLLV